jgi:hypothetical protein
MPEFQTDFRMRVELRLWCLCGNFFRCDCVRPSKCLLRRTYVSGTSRSKISNARYDFLLLVMMTSLSTWDLPRSKNGGPPPQK